MLDNIFAAGVFLASNGWQGLIIFITLVTPVYMALPPGFLIYQQPTAFSHILRGRTTPPIPRCLT